MKTNKQTNKKPKVIMEWLSTNRKTKIGGLLAKALDSWLKDPGFQSHYIAAEIYFASGCTQPYLKNWVEGFPSCPSKGTLSRQSRQTPLKISLSAIGDFFFFFYWNTMEFQKYQAQGLPSCVLSKSAQM